MADHQFSVIIPLYNKANFIGRCLRAVLNQTYEHFEVIIVDDGSTDNSIEKIKDFEDPRIRIYRQENKGVSSARNEGVKKASYNFVVFIDADDTWEQGFLEELLHLVKEFPNAGIFGINHVYKYKDRPDYYERYDQLFNGASRGIIRDYFNLFAKMGKSPFSNSGCCFPQKVFNEVGGYKSGVKLTEDSDLWCRIALSHQVVFSIKPLAAYYVETDNNTRSIIEYKDFQVTQTLASFLKIKNLERSKRRSISKLLGFQQLSLVRRAFLNGKRFFAFKKLYKAALIYHYPILFLGYHSLIIAPSNLLVLVNKAVKRLNLFNN